MKPKSHFLEFYETKCRELKDLEFLGPGYQKDSRTKKMLQGAKKFPALKKLCGEDEGTMFVVLQTFLLLPLAKSTEDQNSTQKRKAKDRPAAIKQYMTKLTKECADNIDAVAFIDPKIDKKKFKEKAKRWIEYKVRMKTLGRARWGDAIEFVCTVDPRVNRSRLRKLLNEWPLNDIDKHNFNQVYKHFGIKEKYNINSDGFNEILFKVFGLCKHKTGQSDYSIHNLMAKVLNSLKINTITGKPFTGANLKSTITRLST